MLKQRNYKITKYMQSIMSIGHGLGYLSTCLEITKCIEYMCFFKIEDDNDILMKEVHHNGHLDKKKQV